MRPLQALLKRVGKFGKLRLALILFVLFSVSGYFYTASLSERLQKLYVEEVSTQVIDRNGKLLLIMPNKRGHYMSVATGTERFGTLVVRSEDRAFYYHPGINPWSVVRALYGRVVHDSQEGGSTITQQLAKNLLGNENTRTIKNKLVEVVYALALELHTPKREILRMYLDVAYFGNQLEGVSQASQYYFGKTPIALTDEESVRLIALLRAPQFVPGSAGNTMRATRIAQSLGIGEIGEYSKVPREIRGVKKDPAAFEVSGLVNCISSCALTVDQELTEHIRSIVRDRLATKAFVSVKNAAVAVIRVGKNGDANEVLALVGTPDPYGERDGNQINMALTPRPIGSTWKPFIYAKAIEGGARPYSIIDDAEYRYEIGTGYAFYPKNYDGIYRGPVHMHYALSNSLNVPAVRALQFVGLDAFSTFMTTDLGFTPRQSFDTYQLSVALGGLEMDTLTLANYFTIFARDGVLAPLTLLPGNELEVPMSTRVGSPKRVLTSTSTLLVSRMLADRLMGIEQFGVGSNLELPFKGYAVKTGTTYDYHDSWTVGYTDEIVVVVWIGNSDNKAMDMVSGARGAGRIWNDVMTLLYSSDNVREHVFTHPQMVDMDVDGDRTFGLAGDDVQYASAIMRSESAIIEPHDHDVLEYEEGMTVPLRSKEVHRWYVGSQLIGEGEVVYWNPIAPGRYDLRAKSAIGGIEKKLQIDIVSPK